MICHIFLFRTSFQKLLGTWLSPWLRGAAVGRAEILNTRNLSRTPHALNPETGLYKLDVEHTASIGLFPDL